LIAVVFDEAALERVQVVAVGETFNSRYMRILVGDREQKAAVCAPAVKQNGTGPALTMVAPLLGAGQA
jgi:hypothetical protein